MTYSIDEQIYKYKLKNKIGGGNFGQVWIAQDVALNNMFAVKLLDQSQYSIDERLLEAQIGNKLQHANVVNIKGADVIQKDDSTVVAIAMPYYVNGSVLSQLNSLNFLDLDKSIKCLIDILRGLEYLHENDYFHCDIKPNNILVGNKGEYLITDYGISCFSPDNIAINPRQCYLPHIAPETIVNNIYDLRTDLYQLGLTAFRLINGVSEIKNEFSGDREKFMENVKNGKVITDKKYQPYVPPAIKRIINKATAKNPDERYHSALEMRRALEKVRLKGNCTADENGNLLIISTGYAYRFEIKSATNGLLNLIVYKRNIRTGKETKAQKYCANKPTNSSIKKALQSMCTELL